MFINSNKMRELIKEFIKVLEGPTNLKSSTRFKLLRQCYKVDDQFEKEEKPIDYSTMISYEEMYFLLEIGKAYIDSQYDDSDSVESIKFYNIFNKIRKKYDKIS